jgi:hypothetical protein
MCLSIFVNQTYLNIIRYKKNVYTYIYLLFDHILNVDSEIWEFSNLINRTANH